MHLSNPTSRLFAGPLELHNLHVLHRHKRHAARAEAAALGRRLHLHRRAAAHLKRAAPRQDVVLDDRCVCRCAVERVNAGADCHHSNVLILLQA